VSTEFLVHLEKEQAARLKSAARKRSTTQTAILREALDKFLADEAATRTARTGEGRSLKTSKQVSPRATTKNKNGIPPSGWAAMAGVPPTKPGEGVGWREHFDRLQKHGRRIRGHFEDDIREADRNRGFR
jgi:hypothetical protein